MKSSEIEVTLIDYMGSDLSVVNAARVSFDKESEYDEDWELSDSDTKLISYLARHKHTSPFNHAFVSFRVKAPVFCARQLVKHKFMPWNETSRRYVTSEPEFYLPTDWRKAADNVKQGSSKETIEILRMRGLEEQTVDDATRKLVAHALNLYTDMLEAGVCPEMARMVLPQNMMTEWIWSGSLGAVADMCRLRLDPHTQEESQVIAQYVSRFMANLYPISWTALMGDNT